MKKIDNSITEVFHNVLDKFINENINSNIFDSSLKEFDIQVNDYFEKQMLLLNNKKTYYDTVRAILVSSHHTILNLGFNYSLIENNTKYSDRFSIRYFIDGSYKWDDDVFYDAENKLYNSFQMNELDEMNIDISLQDMRDKGGESFVLLEFDIDSISEFEY